MSYKGYFIAYNILFQLIGYVIVQWVVNWIDSMYFYAFWGTNYIADIIVATLLALISSAAKAAILFRSVHFSAKHASKYEHVPEYVTMLSFCRIYFGIYAGIQVLYTGYHTLIEYMRMKASYEKFQRMAEAMNYTFDKKETLAEGYAATATAAITGLALAGVILYMIPYTLKTYQRYKND